MSRISRRALLAATAVAGLAGCREHPPRVAVTDADEADPPIDPALVKYRSAGVIETGMAAPSDIAVAANDAILVAGDAEVRSYEPDGKQQGSIAVAPRPTCLAVGPDGAVYVAAADRVRVYGSGGALRSEWPSLGDRAELTGISVGRDDVLLADAGGRRILRCDHAGRELATLCGKGGGYPGLLLPSAYLSVRHFEGGFCVNNPGLHRIERHAADGKLTASFGAEGLEVDRFCGCCNPTDFALLPGGSVVTVEKGLVRIKEYSREGRLLCVVATPSEYVDGTAGVALAVDGRGRVLALDPKKKVVCIYERKA